MDEIVKYIPQIIETGRIRKIWDDYVQILDDDFVLSFTCGFTTLMVGAYFVLSRIWKKCKLCSSSCKNRVTYFHLRVTHVQYIAIENKAH